jgi:hypothetical protein
MYTQTLVEKSIKDGQNLVDALEKAGLDPKAAFWYFNPDLETWKLMIMLPAMDSGDHQHAYKLVEQVRMSTRPQVSISLNDIALQSSYSPLVGAVRWAVRTLPKGAREGSHYIGTNVNNRFIGDVHIYKV